MKSLSERFWSKVAKLSCDCWIWTAGEFTNGYGQFMAVGRPVKAHRWAWAEKHGAIPDGLLVLHKCDNRLCVNPDHLFLGTQADNIHDAQAKGRFQFGARNAWAKLTDDAVKDIRKRGMPGVEYAAKYGVRPQTIYRAWRSESWRHVNG